MKGVQAEGAARSLTVRQRDRKVVIQVFTDAWDEDSAGVQVSYNDAAAVQYCR